MSGRAIIVGGGIAGTAAAVALARKANVTIVLGAPGATHLSSGMIDGSVDEATLAFVESLDGYRTGGSVVATLAGEIRECAGCDRALLDLGRVAGGTILVPRLARLGWDADAIAWMLSAHPLTTSRKLAFRPVDATLLRMSDERAAPDATIAARHDDPARRKWLAERLSHASASAQAEGGTAWLLPPWLGCDRERATELSEQVGIPCGEIATGLSGPCGFRFASARDRVLASAGVASVRAFAREVVEDESGAAVVLESGDTIAGDVVVIATGGLVGGGLVYEPSDTAFGGELPNDPRPYLRATLGDVIVGVRGAALVVPGSLFGVAPETLAWPWVEHGDLERAGVLVDEGGRARGKKRIFAAGEIVADRPRTWLEAARSGTVAGAVAATAIV